MVRRVTAAFLEGEELETKMSEIAEYRSRAIAAIENNKRPGYVIALLRSYFTAKAIDAELREVDNKADYEVNLVVGGALYGIQDRIDAAEEKYGHPSDTTYET